MPGLLSQIEAFSLTLLLGIVAGGIFQYYQLTIRNVHPGKYFLYLLDFILWLFLILLVFLCMLLINQGEMRVYVLIALIIGVAIYYCLLWRPFGLPLSRAAQTTARMGQMLTAGIRRGFQLIRRLLVFNKNTPPPDEPGD